MGIVRLVVDRHVGAKALGGVQSGVGEVDGHDLTRREQVRPHDGGESDGSSTDHGDGVARLDLTIEHAHLVGGREDVSQHQDVLVRAPGGDEVGGRVGERHPHELRLGSVDQVAEDPSAATQALSVAAFPAETTESTGRDAGNQDTLTNFARLHARADLDDGAHGFMPEDPAWRRLRNVAFQDVEIRATDRRGVHLHDDIAVVLDHGIGHLGPAHLAWSVIHKCFHRRTSTLILTPMVRPPRRLQLRTNVPFRAYSITGSPGQKGPMALRGGTFFRSR